MKPHCILIIITTTISCVVTLNSFSHQQNLDPFQTLLRIQDGRGLKQQQVNLRYQSQSPPLFALRPSSKSSFSYAHASSSSHYDPLISSSSSLMSNKMSPFSTSLGSSSHENPSLLFQPPSPVIRNSRRNHRYLQSQVPIILDSHGAVAQQLGVPASLSQEFLEDKISPVVQMKDTSSIPKVLRMMKNGIQSIPGIKAFLLTKDISKNHPKPQIIIASDEDLNAKPGHVIWKFLYSKHSKANMPLSRPPYHQPSSISLSDLTKPYLKKYLMDELKSGHMEIPKITKSISDADSNIYHDGVEFTGNRQAESQNDLVSTDAFGNSLADSREETPSSGPSSSSEVSSKEENEETESRSNSKITKSETVANYQSPESSSSIRDEDFQDPFPHNSHLPNHPPHNGWIPKDSKQWTPGAYRSAFYTPDTRLIRFTIRDRVTTKKPPKKRKQIDVNTRNNQLLNLLDSPPTGDSKSGLTKNEQSKKKNESQLSIGNTNSSITVT